MKRIETWMAVLGAAAFGCAPGGDDEPDQGNGRPDTADTIETGADADADDGTDGFPEIVYDTVWDAVCDEQDFAIAMEPVRLMILLDESSSMDSVLGWGRSHWDEATEGLNHLIGDPVSRNFLFGLDAFPDGTIEYFEGCHDDCCADPICMATQMIRCMGIATRCNRGCAVDLPPIVPLDRVAVSGPAISAYMALDILPGTFTSTPLLRQMQWYLGTGPTAVPEFFADDGASYLLVVSDGADTCDATGDPPDHGPVITGLADTTARLLSERGVKSFAIGFGDTSGAMADELNAIAANGGTPFTRFFPVDEPAALVEAFDTISSSIVSCIYDIEEPSATANPDEVNFYFDGEVVGYDPACTNGWRWTDDSRLQVEFCGASCETLKDGDVERISATFGCATILL